MVVLGVGMVGGGRLGVAVGWGVERVGEDEGGCTAYVAAVPADLCSMCVWIHVCLHEHVTTLEVGSSLTQGEITFLDTLIRHSKRNSAPEDGLAVLIPLLKVQWDFGCPLHNYWS